MADNKHLQTYLLKEVEVIQGVISRMALNSFLIKGWTVTLVVGSMLLKGTELYTLWIAFIPLLVFWYLDAFFLWQERIHRQLYDWVIKNRLETNDNLLDLNAYRFAGNVQSKPRIMFSITLGWFYGAIVLLILVYALLSFYLN